MSSRRQAREMAIQMLYQSDLGGTGSGQVVAEFQPVEHLLDPVESAERDEGPNRADESQIGHVEVEKALAYAKMLVEGTLTHREEIDVLIRQQAEHWRLERMPPVDRNILRLAVYEFLYEADVPQLVILDEAIELAKEFGSEESGRFVNGLLDGILKSHTFPGTLT